MLADLPQLDEAGYLVTSDASVNYNCIAWAAGDDRRWWWPVDLGGYYWPEGIMRVTSLSSFEASYRLLGYEVCPNADLEAELEKVAIFIDDSGVPTHAARQLTDGQWTSKLGPSEDIRHVTLAAIERGVYGRVAVVMSRPRQSG